MLLSRRAVGAARRATRRRRRGAATAVKGSSREGKGRGVVLSGGPTTLKLFSAGGFKNFNIINPLLAVQIDTMDRPYGLKVYCDAVMIHATD